MRYQRSIFPAALGFLFFAFCFVASALSNTGDEQHQPSSAGLSHVRVVRLSFMEGTVRYEG